MSRQIRLLFLSLAFTIPMKIALADSEYSPYYVIIQDVVVPQSTEFLSVGIHVRPHDYGRSGRFTATPCMVNLNQRVQIPASDIIIRSNSEVVRLRLRAVATTTQFQWRTLAYYTDAKFEEYISLRDFPGVYTYSDSAGFEITVKLGRQ